MSKVPLHVANVDTVGRSVSNISSGTGRCLKFTLTNAADLVVQTKEKFFKVQD